jgi:2-succinyl-6-hydroxy-2,4-cyclohexadiene-1-carboxylate synthase
MIATSQFRWHYHTAGDPGLPPLLLLHGFTGCGAVWDDVVAQLQPLFHTITVDCPGHGQTECVDDSVAFSMDMVSSELAMFVRALDLPRVHLWGYSMGGRLALYFAIHHAACCDRLILESASPGIADPHERVRRKEADDALAETILSSGIAGFVDAWSKLPLFASQERLPEEKRERARVLRLGSTATGLARSLRGMGTGVQPPLHDQMSQLNTPTLILTGAQDPKFGAIGNQMAERIPAVVRRIVPHAGHAPHWEDPETCVVIARPFLLGENVPVPAELNAKREA